ncbi:MAG: T9SS type A sorting domain-containing protein [Candidatus Marinimicrobia bacterium]|nr:T9SS type A sorting domain-containing protein [Candidatus Neomarinimicrobiota bacterium]
MVDSVYDIHFDILSDNGLKSEKTIQIKIIAPEKFELFDNYPNPFNPVTNIRYMLPEESKVNLSIYNLRGQLIETLVQKQQVAGIYTANWNAGNYASGVYFYRIKVESTNGIDVLSKKMILVK